ncbi:DMT family transporter [candidate division CSSED10-310 bacterium]|uniref:DMT family transporter n=1 Tax=candidate division CSSED10-310 bacterium TaxID=2855610 RepID=A0ABV6Z236_UNCC1
MVKLSRHPGLWYMFLASVCLSLVGLSIKYALFLGLPVYEVVFFRGIGAAGCIYIFSYRQKTTLIGHNYPLLLARSILGTGSIFLFTFALGNIPLGDVYLLNRTSPIFIALLAGLFLREKTSLAVYPLLALAFTGVALLVKPGSGPINWGSLAALTSGLTTALAHISVRRLTESDQDQVIVFHFMLLSAGLMIPAILFYGWIVPNVLQSLTIGGVIIGSLLGQLFMTRAYRLEPVSNASLLTYAAVVLAAFWGWLFWQELWDFLDFCGALLIITACILLPTVSGMSASLYTTHD